MKYIVSESQLRILLKEDRVTFLRTNNVITKDDLKKYNQAEKEADAERPAGGIKKRVQIEPIQGHDGVDIGYIVTSKKGKESIKVTEEVFEEIVDARILPESSIALPPPVASTRGLLLLPLGLCLCLMLGPHEAGKPLCPNLRVWSCGGLFLILTLFFRGGKLEI